jgi:hypothetical protein
MPAIHAHSDWYLERPELETVWRGVLVRRDAVRGPGSRLGLGYALVASEREFAVYSAGAERLLEPYVGCLVAAAGKLVDLSDEGYGQELWLGSIEHQR